MKLCNEQYILRGQDTELTSLPLRKSSLTPGLLVGDRDRMVAGFSAYQH